MPGHMPQSTLQFRLWTIFAVMALIGWAIVALPYWITIYPEEHRLQNEINEEIDLINSPEARARKAARDYQRMIDMKEEVIFGKPASPPPEDDDGRGLETAIMVGIAVGAFLSGLGVVWWLRNGSRRRFTPERGK